MTDQWGIEEVYVVTSDYGDCINGVFSSMENAVAYVNKRVIAIPGIGISDYLITERTLDKE